MRRLLLIGSASIVAGVVLLAQAQSLQPGQSLLVTCAGQWANVSTGSTIAADCVEVPPVPASFVVNHTSVAAFDAIPAQFLELARAQTFLFVDRSVGSNIHDGLNCLQSTYATAVNSCKRYLHVVPEFSNPPETWDGSYPRPNWAFASNPGTGILPELPQPFVVYLDANPGRYQVAGWMPSYLDINGGASAAESYVADMDGLRSRHSGLTVVLFTSSLARGIGNADSTAFNARVRELAVSRGYALLDIADIESTDPSGQPCVDNRDGVPYSTGTASENYPDDGVSYPAICQHYTREAEGGHLGNPDVGKIKIAKAIWVLMAKLAGWGG